MSLVDTKTSARRKARTERQQRQASRNRVALTKQIWLETALEEVSRAGVGSIKILPLSKKLGVTRGSFYHHFADRGELLSEMLDYWEHELTDSVIHRAKSVDGTPRQRVEDILVNVITNRQYRFDTAIAAWGLSDERVAEFYSRIVRKRTRFMATQLRATGLSTEEAAFRARVVFGFFVTYTQARPKATRAEALRDAQRCLSLVFN